MLMLVSDLKLSDRQSGNKCYNYTKHKLTLL